MAYLLILMTASFTEQKFKILMKFYICQERRIGERDSWGVWDRHVHTAILKMDNHQRPAI